MGEGGKAEDRGRTREHGGPNDRGWRMDGVTRGRRPGMRGTRQGMRGGWGRIANERTRGHSGGQGGGWANGRMGGETANGERTGGGFSI